MTLFKQLVRILKMTRKVGGWKAAAAMGRQLPLQVSLHTRLLGDARVPVVAKVALVAALIYAVSPLDLIPDWIPIVGGLDDIGIALWAINFFGGQVPLDVMAEHKRAVGLPTGLVDA